jgi:hypothetical protein
MLPFPSNPMRCRRALFFSCLAAVVFLAALSDAETETPRRHRAKSTVVALQPFSLDQPSRVRLAYYSHSPRAIPRAEVRDRDDGDESDSNPKIENNSSHPTVPGKRAVLRNGVAYAPSNAPDSVKSAIWAANKIRHKPYVWGGGHGSFNDSGYDCSGTVSYALHQGGLLGAPIASSDFLRYGDRGRGKWITVYARHGHTFAVIAGLRLDTTDFSYGGDIGPRWHNDGRDTRGFDARHPVGL